MDGPINVFVPILQMRQLREDSGIRRLVQDHTFGADSQDRNPKSTKFSLSPLQHHLFPFGLQINIYL